jgi:hypothetical protein
VVCGTFPVLLCLPADSLLELFFSDITFLDQKFTDSYFGAGLFHNGSPMMIKQIQGREVLKKRDAGYYYSLPSPYLTYITARGATQGKKRLVNVFVWFCAGEMAGRTGLEQDDLPDESGRSNQLNR